MLQFTYSFCMAMLHSLWQAAMLLLLYTAVDKILFRNNSPLAKRNFLFAILFSQTFLFIFTFFVFFFNSGTYGSFTQTGQTITEYVGEDNLRYAAPWIFGFYVLGISYKLAKSVYLWFIFRQQYRYGLQKPAVELKLFTALKAHQFGITRKVKLWLSSTIHTPVTFGFFKPVILLPVALINNISTKQAETLILHELTHIRTNDYLLNWFLIVIESIFFFNPFVSNLCNKLRMEREKNCDLNVMAFEYSPALYAETLLQAEMTKQLIPDFQLAAVNHKKQLLQRIHFFSGNTDLAGSMRFNLVAPLVGLVLFMLISSAVLFQSGNKTALTASAGFLPFAPVSSLELVSAELAENSPTIINNPEIIIKEAENQKPVLKQEPKRSEKVINSIQLQTEELRSKQLNENLVIPVAIKENDVAKQIIIQEECSGSSNSSVKVYYLSFENGQWVLTPEWILSAKEINDSLLNKINTGIADSVKRKFPSQQ